MPFFSSSDELQLVMADLWQEIKKTPDMCEELLAARVIVQFRYREPEGLITINCGDGRDMFIEIGFTRLKPDIEISMKADIAHEFWLGRINLPAALLLGEIVSLGPTLKALALLPVWKPACALYSRVLELRGKNPRWTGLTEV